MAGSRLSSICELALISLRSQLAESGFVADGQRVALPTDAKHWPTTGSLMAVMRSMNDPAVVSWSRSDDNFTGGWANKAQGIATDGSRWFVTANEGSQRGISRYSRDFETLELFHPISKSVAGHIGDLDFFDGVLYLALENPERIARYTAGLEPIGPPTPLNRPLEGDGRHFSWCAVNPWNGLLYTCDWGETDKLVAYDRRTGENRDAQTLEIPFTLERVQGGTFSPNGRVYLACDSRGGHPRISGIYVFRLLDGAFLGSVSIPMKYKFPHFDEIEGITFGNMSVKGISTQLHLLFLNKDAGDDTVRIWSYRMPSHELPRP